jgi:hypothetical protein
VLLFGMILFYDRLSARRERRLQLEIEHTRLKLSAADKSAQPSLPHVDGRSHPVDDQS